MENCLNIESINVDKSFKLFFYENIKDQLIQNSIKLQKKLVEQRQEDLDLLASSNINVNVLPLSEKEVMIFDELGTIDYSLARELEKNGFEPVPVRLRHSRLFGGGLHCCTLDTVRDDKYEDFFN